MGTVIEGVSVDRAGWRDRHSALRLAVTAGRDCLRSAERDPRDVDLLINAGIYRDRNLGEPALAALIQQDIGANPEDPHSGGHGTFSFDITNGSCGALTALQIVDGFMSSRVVDCAMVVASDADPGHGLSEHFPFSPIGAAILCGWSDANCGLGRVHWARRPEDGDSFGGTFQATVGLVDRRNVLRFRESAALDDQFATAAAEAAADCLDEASLDLSDVDAIVAAPARPGYRLSLAQRLGVPVDRLTVAADDRTHTASLAAAFADGAQSLSGGSRLLLIAAGAGVMAGAAIYRQP